MRPQLAEHTLFGAQGETYASQILDGSASSQSREQSSPPMTNNAIRFDPFRLPLTRGEHATMLASCQRPIENRLCSVVCATHAAGWTPTQAVTPEKTGGRAQSAQNDHHRARVISGVRTIADRVLSTCHQLSCSTSHLLQTRGEK